MRIRHDRLEAALKASLAGLYVVTGDEHLLVMEAADAIRRAARVAGYEERELLQSSRSFQWTSLGAATQSMSLFGARKLIDLRIPGGKPGREGSAALIAHAAALHSDFITLITLPRLEREQRNAAWLTALDNAGVIVEVPQVEPRDLPSWIGARLARQSQSASAEGLAFIAERVEGNLLAAHQEIQKLALLHKPGALAISDIHEAVLNVARFDVFKLGEAMLGGEAARLARMLEGLRAEGTAAPLVLWALADEIRSLAQAQQAQAQGASWRSGLEARRLWGKREQLLEAALRRLKAGVALKGLRSAARIDRMIKGIPRTHEAGEIWDEMLRLGLGIAGEAL